MITVGPSLKDPAYDAAVLQAITHGDYSLDYAPLTLSGGGHTIELLVFADALKMDVQYVDSSYQNGAIVPGATKQANDTRIAVSAQLEQQIADALGCMLMTAIISERRFTARGVTIPPFPLTATTADLALMATTARMVRESTEMDAALGAPPERGVIIGTTGKDWVLDALLIAKPGYAVNSGWFLPKGTGSPWHGVPIYVSPGLTAMVIQQPSTDHVPSHIDYSQQCVLVHRACKVDGQDRDLAEVLRDPVLGPIIGGPLTVLRQPSVPIFSCALSGAVAASPDLCPLPPAPTPAPKPSKPTTGGGAGIVIAAGAALAATAAGWWWLTRRRARPSRV